MTFVAKTIDIYYFIKTNSLFLSLLYLKSHVCFQCDICHKSFKQKHGLNYHMQSHTGKVFTVPCVSCDEKFFDTVTMKLHRESGQCGMKMEHIPTKIESWFHFLIFIYFRRVLSVCKKKNPLKTRIARLVLMVEKYHAYKENRNSSFKKYPLLAHPLVIFITLDTKTTGYMARLMKV